MLHSAPAQQGLYDPANEHDACGVGFVAHIKGTKSHDIVAQGLKILENLDHRGAVGADPLMGDGAGILIQLPHAFYRAEMAKSRIGCATSKRIGGLILSLSSKFGLGPMNDTSDITICSRIGSIGGFVTCAKSCLK